MDIDRKQTSPRNIVDNITVKKGSIALIVWVNETETFPRLMLVEKLPNVCITANGRIATSWVHVIKLA